MKDTLLDISGKIDPITRDLYSQVGKAAHEQDIDWVIIGATARDLIYEAAYGIKFERATRDVDFAVHVESWEKFDLLSQSLTRTGAFRRQDKSQKFFFDDGTSNLQIDVVPFGGLADQTGRIGWPPEHETVMSALGLDDTLRTAVKCRLIKEPDLTVKVAHPTMLVLLKLFAWDERRSWKITDAGDAAQAMSRYLDLGNGYRLDAEPGLFEEDFDMDTVGARLMGRDIASRTSAPVLKKLQDLITAEVESGERSRLLADMARSNKYLFPFPDMYSQLLRQLARGLSD